MACGNNKNPLKHGGTSQQQRLLRGMQKDYVAIDERDFADWIAFAQQFAIYLKYVDLNNRPAGNWKPFFESDISAVLGTMAIQNIDEYKVEVKRKFDVIKSNNERLSYKKEALSSLFAGVLTLAKGLDYFISKLPDEEQLKINIRNLIRVRLQPAMHKLLTYYKGAKNLGLIKDKDDPSWKVFGSHVVKSSTLVTEGLSSIWHKGSPLWLEYYSGLQEERSIYGDPALDQIEKISHAANHNFFKGLLNQFLMSYAKIINDSETALLNSLNTSGNHTPHYTLFLTFLKLFRVSREHINTLAQSHLDFYYKEVLRIKHQSGLPDKVHLLIELAKQTDTHLLSKGTLFKAGKDKLGMDILYEMEKDVVFNKAKVGRLMSVYRSNAADSIGSVNNQGRLFASPVSNSSDGLGKEIQTVHQEWHPYVNKTYVDGSLTIINMPPAQIGFAIASSNLYLTEGERLVNLKFAPAFSPLELGSLATVECYLTTEKGWYHVPKIAWTSGEISGPTNVSILSFTLAGDVDPVANYNSEVHGGAFDTDVPVLKVFLTNNTSAVYSYDVLKNINITKVELEVKVGLDSNDAVISGGLKDLLLSNDFGVLDPSKPFLPFGPAPKSSASFIIGSRELFKKRNAKLFFNVLWKDLPSYSFTIDYDELVLASTGYTDLNPRVKASTLEGGVWKDISSPDIKILSDFLWTSTALEYVSAPELVFPSALLALPAAVIVDYDEDYAQYNITSSKGFIKLTLRQGFGHAEYQKQLTRYLIEQAKESPDSSITEPAEPYTPTIQRLTLHYKASVSSTVNSTTGFKDRDLRFFHIHPFGEAEQHTRISGSSTISLLPELAFPAKNAENAGELYIGIENLQGGQSVNILFQVLEGTSNVLLDKPEDQVLWSYLTNNKWIAFDDRSVTDNTNELIQSGIISFIIPRDASLHNTLLPPGYIWLRASVTEAAEAVCKIVSITAQAAVVKLVTNSNVFDFSGSALAPGTISKLKEPSAAVKKITQPYASFGGRPVEDSNHFYVRVSERLRHKNRAVTIWDYEHLILEAFPAVHKVKCINHTKFQGNDYNEIAPGHVTIITVPNLQNRIDANPLRPYTNQNVLEEIEAFIKKRTSCHVKVDVRHPQFEEVRLEFKLKLHIGYEFNFYRALLQKEITGFLTPWAYVNTADIELGGKVHKSVLINFIEERSYVDYITDVRMYHRKDESLAAESSDTDTIEASTAKSLLVSAPSSKHVVYELIEPPEIGRLEDCADEFNHKKRIEVD